MSDEPTLRILICPDCGVATTHPEDIVSGYCFRCHWWTSDVELGPARALQWPERVAEAHSYRINHAEQLAARATRLIEKLGR